MSRSRVIAVVAVAAVVVVSLGWWLLAGRSVAPEPVPSAETVEPGSLGVRVAVDPRAGAGTGVAADRLAITDGGATVLVAVPSDQCHGLVDAVADEDTSPDVVYIAVEVGPLPELDEGCEPVPATWEVAVPLEAPLGERRLVDSNG